VRVDDVQSRYQTSEYQFTVTFKKFGIGVKWVTENTPEAFAAAIDDKTKAIFVESIANPKYILSDIPVLAKVIYFFGGQYFFVNTQTLDRS